VEPWICGKTEPKKELILHNFATRSTKSMQSRAVFLSISARRRIPRPGNSIPGASRAKLLDHNGKAAARRQRALKMAFPIQIPSAIVYEVYFESGPSRLARRQPETKRDPS
jgi:hypothetical protein